MCRFPAICGEGVPTNLGKRKLTRSVSFEVALFVSHEVAAEFSRGREPTEKVRNRFESPEGAMLDSTKALGRRPSGA